MPSVHDRTKRFIYRSEFWSLKLKQPTAWPRCHTYNVCEEFNIEFPRERPGRKMLKHTHTHEPKKIQGTVGQPAAVGVRNRYIPKFRICISRVDRWLITAVMPTLQHVMPETDPPPPGFIFVVLRFIVSLGCKCD